jgi:hypothetical protein
MTQAQMQELLEMKWEKVTLTPSETIFTEKHCLALPNYVILISKYKDLGYWLVEILGTLNAPKPEAFKDGKLIKDIKDLSTEDAQKAILAYIVDELNNEMRIVNERLNMLNSIHTSIFNFNLVNIKLNIE